MHKINCHGNKLNYRIYQKYKFALKKPIIAKHQGAKFITKYTGYNNTDNKKHNKKYFKKYKHFKSFFKMQSI